MADTTFVSKVTVIPVAWLQDINDLYYKGTKALTVTTLTASTVTTPIVDSGSTASIFLRTNGQNGVEIVDHASIVNRLQVAGRESGVSPRISVTSAVDANVGLAFFTKGAGSYIFSTDIGGAAPTQFQVSHTAGATRFPTFTGSLTAGIDGVLGSNSTGAILLANGQLQFPAVQNPSANANTLDDYEEGTWTPAVGGTATYTTQSGTYTKIGRFVFVQMTLTINLIGTGSPTQISGLPFTAAVQGALAISNFTSTASSLNYTVGQVPAGTTVINMRGTTTASTSVGAVNTFGNGTTVELSGCYTV